MIQLPKTLNAWGSSHFNQVFKEEASLIQHHSLPLQQGLAQSSYVSDDKFTVVVLNNHADELLIHIKAGIFYTGIIAGCSCADDPTPLDTQNEYCEVTFTINRQSAETVIELL